jgi:hypothetical protein
MIKYKNKNIKEAVKKFGSCPCNDYYGVKDKYNKRFSCVLSKNNYCMVKKYLYDFKKEINIKPDIISLSIYSLLIIIIISLVIIYIIIIINKI